MAMIKKLSIQGVRSFSPADNKGQCIEFGSPLTLILGVNGSGKTTIIETLKYAITSQFPPNSAKGASFVNDPKLSYSDSSLAKILLELTDGQGNTYITTRKVKAMVKNCKGDLSMQQLEGTLRVKNVKGESHQLTNKCSDVKFEMSRLMGVSEAMLNHVIFCHQEESCWPLDEGKKVKETFDAIFNTTAYKKCFDRLGVIDKEYQTKIKVEVEGLKYVKENRELTLKYQNDLTNKNIELHQQSDTIKEYERDIKVMEKKLLEFQALEQEFAKKQSEVAEKRTRIEAVGKHIAELRTNIKEEFSGSSAELKESIDKFKEESSSKRQQSRDLNEQYKKKETEWNTLNVQKSKLLKEEGMLQQEENANKKRLEELNGKLMDVVDSMKRLKDEVGEEMLSTSFVSYLDACDSHSGNLSYETVHKTLTNAIKIKDSELQKVRAEFDKEENELQSAIDDVRAKMAALDTEKDMKKQQLVSSRKTQEDIKNRLKALEGSNETLMLLDDDEENFMNQIEAIEKSGFMVKCDSDIKKLAAEVKSLESKISTVSDSVNVLVADKSKTDQIAMLNRQKLNKETDCSKIMRQMEDELNRILEEIPDEKLLEAVDSKIKTLTNDAKVNKAELREKEKALTGSKSELKYITADLKKMESKLRTGKSKVTDVLEDGEYDAVYTEVTETLDKLQSECHYAEAGSFLYKKYLAKLGKSNCCPLCKRDFETQELLRKMKSDIERDITRMKENLPKSKEELETMKKRQQLVINSKPVWDECKQLETEIIPGLKTKKAELEEKIENLDNETTRLSEKVGEIESNIAIASKCRSNVAIYEQGRREMKNTEEQITKIEKSRDPDAKSCTMTLADAQTELQELQGSMKNKRSEKESKEDTRNKKRDELAKLQAQKNKVKEDKLKITAELQNREALETQKKELETATKDLQAKITEITQALPSLKTEITKAEKNKSSCVQRREGALKKLREEKDVLEKQKYGITELHKRILDFEKKQGKLAEVQQSVADCNDKLLSSEKERKDISSQIDKLRKDLTSQEIRHRELQDNLSLKTKLEEVSKLKVELKDKEKVLSQAENHGAATERRALGEKHRHTSAKLNALKGSTDEIKKSIRELEKELASPQFANAEKQYIEKVARKCIYEKTLRDTRVYKTALDTAIMKFHEKKMEKINKILMEYWRRIYKGNDIDKIMIKTEADKDPGSEAKPKKVKVTTGTVRKNYNYRVVMCRRGVDIDMRGRCSAGQRVLASIIIRIALAESFGARCGIIALDEPTTNLDQRNINSLGDALSDLAEKMGSRKNFQLIVITHDQEFTQRLTAVDAVEHYWKVDRDKDGFSKITNVPKRGYDD